MPHDVFVSYATEDEAPADAVRAALEGAGIRCWIARRDITPGASWPAAIVRAIGESRAMLLVFSASSNNSEQTKREVAQAVGKGIPILPVRIEELEPSGDMAYFLVTPHWLDAHAPPFEQHLRHLVATVKTILGRPRDPPPAPAPATGATRVVTGPNDPFATHRSPARPLLLAMVCLACLGVGAWGAYTLVHSRTGAAPQSAGRERAGDPAGTLGSAATPRASSGNSNQSGGIGVVSGSGNNTVAPQPAPPAAGNPIPGSPAAPSAPSSAPAAIIVATTTAAATSTLSRPAAPAAEITITSPKPGITLASAVPLPLGQVVAARLDDPNSPTGRHFWRLDVPAGDYKLVWDVRAASGEATNVGGSITLLSPDGENPERVLFMSDTGYRCRALGSFGPRLPVHVIVRVDNGPRAEDYWLGLFPRGQAVPVPYFTDRPPVEPLAEGKPATTLLDGRTEKTHAAWYALDLPPGDYKVTATFTLLTGRPSNLAGYVDLFDADGVERRSSLIFDSLVDVEFRKSAKVSVAAGARTILRVRAGAMREYATLTVTKWAGD